MSLAAKLAAKVAAAPSEQALQKEKDTSVETAAQPPTPFVMDGYAENTYQLHGFLQIITADGRAHKADANGFITADSEEKLQILEYFAGRGQALKVK